MQQNSNYDTRSKSVKISVIMPLYNAERYLEESLKSVLSQSLSDFELICINDGSTDNTLNILRTFQKEDNRIVVLENAQRQGAAYSRNKGIEAAKGKYLSFLDGDDIFEEEMLEAGYQAAFENAVDVVIYEYKHVLSEVIHQKERVNRRVEYKEKFCRKPFQIKDVLPCEFLLFSSSPCNKLYRREFIMTEHLRFQTLSCSNDVYFVLMAIMLAKEIFVLDDDRVMVYARDHFESSRISFDRDPMCAYKAMEKLQQALIRRGQFGELYQHFYYRLFFTLQCALENIKTAEQQKQFYDYIKYRGIRVFCSTGNEFYERLDPYIKHLLEQFEIIDFNTGCYEKINMLYMFLEGKTDKVIRLFQNLTQENKKVGVWGVGRNGQILLEFCKRKQLQMEMVIDIDPEKQGQQITGYKIQPPEQAYDKLQTVIVVGRVISESVRQFLESRKIDINVICIDEYLELIF